MHFRNLIIFACLPLAAFSCVTISSIAVRPSAISQTQTLELITQRFSAIKEIVDLWADQNGYSKQECSKTNLTPLCKAYVYDNTRIIVAMDSTNNFVNVEFLKLGGGSVDGIKNSLKEKLSADTKWTVRDKD
jgi:hypothetical protein